MSRQSRERPAFEPRQIFVLLLCLGTLSYYVHQASQTRYGLETRTRLLERSVALSQQLGRLEAVRAILERDTTRLAADPPDLDLLGEHARGKLGFARPDERRLVVPRP